MSAAKQIVTVLTFKIADFGVSSCAVVNRSCPEVVEPSEGEMGSMKGSAAGMR